MHRLVDFSWSPQQFITIYFCKRDGKYRERENKVPKVRKMKRNKRLFFSLYFLVEPKKKKKSGNNV